MAEGRDAGTADPTTEALTKNINSQTSMAYEFISLTPATDWFFVPKHSTADDLGIKHVAAWALTSDGRIVGMVPAGATHPPSLQAADRDAGRFKHRDTLNADERKALDRSH